MIENPMYSSYPEDEEPDFEIPGIDDCDYLYTASDGDGSVYIRVQESPHVPGIFYASVTVDSESGSFADDLEIGAGPFDSPDEACRKLAHHFDWFGENGVGEVELCSDTKRALSLENKV
jgi:hypothetical protein